MGESKNKWRVKCTAMLHTKMSNKRFIIQRSFPRNTVFPPFFNHLRAQEKYRTCQTGLLEYKNIFKPVLWSTISWDKLFEPVSRVICALQTEPVKPVFWNTKISLNRFCGAQYRGINYLYLFRALFVLYKQNLSNRSSGIQEYL